MGAKKTSASSGSDRPRSRPSASDPAGTSPPVRPGTVAHRPATRSEAEGLANFIAAKEGILPAGPMQYCTRLWLVSYREQEIVELSNFETKQTTCPIKSRDMQVFTFQLRKISRPDFNHDLLSNREWLKSIESNHYFLKSNLCLLKLNRKWLQIAGDRDEDVAKVHSQSQQDKLLRST